MAALTLLAASAALAVPARAQAPAAPSLTDPECTGPVHGRTRSQGETLVVTMVSGTVAPGTRGVVCVPYAIGERTGMRLVREVVAVAAWSDQVRVDVVKRSATELVPDAQVTFAAVERFGSATIEVSDGRAAVWFGGARLGGTPFVVPLPEGAYTFEVVRAGFEPTEVTLAVRSGQPATARVVLVPLGTGADPTATRGGPLRITSVPAGAEVWIDGARAGTTPHTASGLSAGPHHVELLQDTLAAAPRVVNLGVRDQTEAFDLGPQPGYLLVRTVPAGRPVVLENGDVRATPALVAAAPGTRSVRAEGVGYRALAAPVVVQSGLLTVTRVAAEAALGWIHVQAPEGARVRVGEVEVGQGALRLRVPVGMHTVSVTVNEREVAREVAVVEDGSTVTVSAGGGPGAVAGGPGAGPAAGPVVLGGAVAAIDMPDPPALLAAVPARVETRSAPELAAAPPPVTLAPSAVPSAPGLPAAPVPGGGSPLDRVGSGAADPTCAAVVVGQLGAEADDRLVGGDYGGSRACLLRLAVLDPATASYVSRRIQDIDAAVTSLQIRPDDAALVRAAHGQMLAFARRGDRASLGFQAQTLFRVLPSDPAGLAILRRALSATLPLPASGLVAETVYVPGASERAADDSGLVGVQGPPAAGFRLAVTETTNREFATYLNTLAVRDAERLLFRRPVRIEAVEEPYLDGRRHRSRTVFRPTAGADDLPAVDATWAGADAYARWAGGRLPTAAEWLWALRSGQRGRPDLPVHLVAVPRPVAPVAVRSLPADAVGLYHMTGNVWEWVAPDRAGSPNLFRAGGGSYTTDRASLTRNALRTFGEDDSHDQTGWRVLFPFE